MRAVLLLTFLSLVWLDLPARAQQAPRISEIIVLGNKVLNKESIISAAGLKVGDLATPQALESARTRLLNTGNFGALHPEDAVKIRLADLNPDRNEAKVIIEVQENDVVKGFNITGTGPIPVKDVLAQIQTKPGYVLNMNTLAADVKRIQDYYDSKGYIATVDDTKVGFPDGILTLPIVVGRIGKITIHGLHKTKPKVVLREMREKQGDYYNDLQLRKDYTRLFNTQLFDDIQVSRLTPQPGTVDLTLNTQEKRTGTVGLSIGYSSLGGVLG